jgi:hypothetical protein
MDLSRAVVKARGEPPYGSREYLLLVPPTPSKSRTTTDADSLVVVARLRAHRNGTSLDEFGWLRELISLLDYYLIHQEKRLQITTKGRRVAMLRHRSWHRIEE